MTHSGIDRERFRTSRAPEDQGTGNKGEEQGTGSFVFESSVDPKTKPAVTRKADLDLAETCEWRVLPNGQFVCNQPASYRAWFYGTCDNPACPDGQCVGATICEQHAAELRTDPALRRITTLDT